MKKLMLPIVAFVVFFALGSGAGAFAMKPDVVADSLHADSTHADSTHGDSAAPGGEHAQAGDTTGGATVTPHNAELPSDGSAPPTDPHAADPGRAPSGNMTGPPASGAGMPAPAGTPRPGQVTIGALVRAQAGATVTMRRDGTIGPERPDARAGTADSLPDYARMARLLSRMGPREAARTIEQLSGTEAARALGAMSDKQAALVLQQLSPEKAASLLQATLALLPKTVTP